MRPSRLALVAATGCGRIGAADSLCQGDATAAGLTGSYQALLATTGASAIS